MFARRCSHSVETKHLVVLDIVAQNGEMDWGLQAAYEREMIKSIAWRDFYKPSDQSCVAVLKLRWGRRRKWEKVWHLARAWYMQMLIRDHEIMGEMAPGQALGCLQEMKDNDFQPGVPYLLTFKGLILALTKPFWRYLHSRLRSVRVARKWSSGSTDMYEVLKSDIQEPVC